MESVRKSLILIAGVVILSSWVFGYGNGTPEHPYQIESVADLIQLSATPTDWDKCFVLMEDINLVGLTFTQAPIAPDISNTTPLFQGTPFTGVFDGNGHCISNLTIAASSQDYVGLFGNVDLGGQIKYLGIKNANLVGHYNTGSIAGQNSGSITSCYVAGMVTGMESGAGGLVGQNSGTIVSSCASNTIMGYGYRSYAGGLVGYNYSGSIVSCYATGNVAGTGHTVGGLVGENSAGIMSCYATGSVVGANGVGGLVGSNFGNIFSCYARGIVTATTYTPYVGGLVGTKYYSGTTTNCFWDKETSGQMTSAGGIGKTTVEMKTLATFVEWDFSDVWAICEGTNYPRLQWQIPAGDWVCPYGVNVEDLSFFIERWMIDGCGLSNHYCGGTDLDISGMVNLVDWVLFAKNWLTDITDEY